MRETKFSSSCGSELLLGENKLTGKVQDSNSQEDGNKKTDRS
jgi:hypothetical protein